MEKEPEKTETLDGSEALGEAAGQVADDIIDKVAEAIDAAVESLAETVDELKDEAAETLAQIAYAPEAEAETPELYEAPEQESDNGLSY